MGLNMRELDGKVALVTGGSRGIGAAIATRLADDGADVALTYQRAEGKAHGVVNEVKKAGRRALAIEANSADPKQSSTPSSRQPPSSEGSEGSEGSTFW